MLEDYARVYTKTKQGKDLVNIDATARNGLFFHEFLGTEHYMETDLYLQAKDNDGSFAEDQGRRHLNQLGRTGATTEGDDHR